MMKSRFSLGLGLFLAVGFASAASPVGSWTGKVSLTKMPAMATNATPQQKAMIMSAMNKMRFKLDMKANKTFSITMVGAPTAAPQKPQTGTWSQKGNVITTTIPSQNKPPQQLNLSADGKTMTLVMPNSMGKIVFTR